MIRNVISIFIVVLLLNACDSTEERIKKTFEERLEDVFEQSEKSVQDRVAVAVNASRDKNYVAAMNELAILSKTHMNNGEQEQAISLLMTQLRNAMETEELAKKATRDNN
ncbi:MAG: hypothetical protein P8H03_06150 [Emcibacteraceae bacterium]|nr:hypothetical protein [Emcibacteraceae bacterium]